MQLHSHIQLVSNGVLYAVDVESFSQDFNDPVLTDPVLTWRHKATETNTPSSRVVPCRVRTFNTGDKTLLDRQQKTPQFPDGRVLKMDPNDGRQQINNGKPSADGSARLETLIRAQLIQERLLQTSRNESVRLMALSQTNAASLSQVPTGLRQAFPRNTFQFPLFATHHQRHQDPLLDPRFLLTDSLHGAPLVQTQQEEDASLLLRLHRQLHEQRIEMPHQRRVPPALTSSPSQTCPLGGTNQAPLYRESTVRLENSPTATQLLDVARMEHEDRKRHADEIEFLENTGHSGYGISKKTTSQVEHQLAQDTARGVQLDQLNHLLASNVASQYDPKEDIRTRGANACSSIPQIFPAPRLTTSQAFLQEQLRTSNSMEADRKPRAIKKPTHNENECSGSNVSRVSGSICADTNGRDDKASNNGKNSKSKSTERQSAKYNAFPLPSTKSRRDIRTSKLLSFHALWSELEDAEMQEEIFRQRIFEEKNVRIVGKSRSVKIAKKSFK